MLFQKNPTAVAYLKEFKIHSSKVKIIEFIKKMFPIDK